MAAFNAETQGRQGSQGGLPRRRHIIRPFWGTHGDSAVKQNKAVFVFNVFDELRRIAPVK